MKLQNPKLAAAFDFVCRERIYFFVLVLTLVLLAFNHFQSIAVEAASSSAVDQLEQASRTWGEAHEGVGAWIQLFQTRPAAVIVCLCLMVLFTSLFLGGLVILVSVSMIPRFYRWFQNVVLRSPEPEWKPVLFFRVLILIFSFLLSSATLIETFFGGNAANENWIGLFHTLLIDVFACFAVLAVLKADGLMTWSQLIGQPPGSRLSEIKRGLTVYTAAFPIFISGLVLVLGISQWLHYEPPPHPLIKIFVEEESRSPFIFQFALILATIGAPIFEEIFFRGFCYRVFRSWWGVQGAMLMSAAFFAGIHGSGFAFFPIFILGMALAWLYEKRGSLTACWTFHVLHNILFTGYFFAIKALIGNS